MSDKAARKTPELVAIGNPGCGKSTLGNCLAGKVIFDARPSRTGAGVTEASSEPVLAGKYMFIDTPGLADAKTRQTAAQEITKALKRDMFHVKVLFMYRMYESRLIDEDKVTLQLTLEAIKKDVGQNRYGILINKVDEDWLNDWYQNPAIRKEFLDVLWDGIPEESHTDKIFFNPEDKALKGKTNVVKELPPKLAEWLDSTLPTVHIKKENVGDVNTQGWREMAETIKKANLARQEAEAKAKAADDRAAEAKREQRKAEDAAAKAQADADARAKAQLEKATAKANSDADARANARIQEVTDKAKADADAQEKFRREEKARMDAEKQKMAAEAEANTPGFIIGVKSHAGGKNSWPGEPYLKEDTNKGKGGDYVYVAPVYGIKKDACQGFELRVNSESTAMPPNSTGDLAKGAGGEFRYIVPVKNGTDRRFVRQVWWSETKSTNCTEDINKGRRGRDLFFCWSY